MASSSTPPQCTYHVFLSFRGEDTRKAFTDHLYTALLGSGFRTFRDNDGIGRGENVKSELDNAIRESSSSIIVFSKDYASSRWCLDELVMILEHKRTSGHVILPVFYDVDPSQVRKQMGNFAEAFGRHEERFMRETNERKKEYLRKKVEEWRAALREVADLAGMVLQNQADGAHEAKFIQKIFKVIGDKLNCTVLNVAPYLIGIGSRVKNISSWLQDESTDVGIAVIYGMGGIGKTTIAKFVYNLNFERFEEKISSVDEGIIKIKDAIGCKRVLVVLDDVDQRDQFDAIIGMRNWFHPGSKISLTTRHKQLLKANEVYMMHNVERFDDDESLELFSWHAFGQDHPIDCYVEHSKRGTKNIKDGCSSLGMVQGMFKLEPIGNAGTEMINNLGLVDLESMGSLEVELANNMTCTRKKGALQVKEVGVQIVYDECEEKGSNNRRKMVRLGCTNQWGYETAE
ncbi:unnamed protein product [Camellia sinensis]